MNSSFNVPCEYKYKSIYNRNKCKKYGIVLNENVYVKVNYFPDKL